MVVMYQKHSSFLDRQSQKTKITRRGSSGEEHHSNSAIKWMYLELPSSKCLEFVTREAVKLVV